MKPTVNPAPRNHPALTPQEQKDLMRAVYAPQRSLLDPARWKKGMPAVDPFVDFSSMSEGFAAEKESNSARNADTDGIRPTPNVPPAHYSPGEERLLLTPPGAIRVLPDGRYPLDEEILHG